MHWMRSRFCFFLRVFKVDLSSLVLNETAGWLCSCHCYTSFSCTGLLSWGFSFRESEVCARFQDTRFPRIFFTFIEKIIVWHFGHVTKDGDKVRFSAHSFVFDADVETPATNAILLYNFTEGPSTGALEVRNPSLLVQSCGSGLRHSFMPRWCMRLKKRCWLTTSCVQRLCWGVRFHSWCWAWLHRIFLHWPGRF